MVWLPESLGFDTNAYDWKCYTLKYPPPPKGLTMNHRFAQLLNRLTPAEEREVENFTAAILARRDNQEHPIQTEDISSEELIQLIADSGSFDWLDAPEEDIYSITDGKAVQWDPPQ